MARTTFALTLALCVAASVADEDLGMAGDYGGR